MWAVFLCDIGLSGDSELGFGASKRAEVFANYRMAAHGVYAQLAGSMLDLDATGDARCLPAPEGSTPGGIGPRSLLSLSPRALAPSPPPAPRPRRARERPATRPQPSGPPAGSSGNPATPYVISAPYAWPAGC